MSNFLNHENDATKQIIIQPFGLEDKELRMLRSLCMITSIAKGSRNRKYVIANPGDSSDICLVDAKQAEVYSRWRNSNKQKSMPAVMVADPDQVISAMQHESVALRPLIPSRLLEMLDSIQISEAV